MSTVNFDTTATSLAFEGLGLALSHTAAIAAFRIAKLMSPGFSGLPRFLTPKAAARTPASPRSRRRRRRWRRRSAISPSRSAP